MTPLRSLAIFCLLVAIASVVYAGIIDDSWPLGLTGAMVVLCVVFAFAELLGDRSES